MYRFFNQKAQSTLEYAVLIAVIVAALLVMQKYTNRAFQGRIRSSVDDIGEQYSAGNVTAKYTTTHEPTRTKERFGTDGSFAGRTNEGVSRYEIITAGQVTRKATEADAEKITKTFKQEKEAE